MPAINDHIAMVTKICPESGALAMENPRYFLHPQRGSHPQWTFTILISFVFLTWHHHRPRKFTSNIPDSRDMASDPRSSRYLCPKFDEELAIKVKNIAIARHWAPDHIHRRDGFIFDEFWRTTAGVEVLVLADPLHHLCYEIACGEELVWISGALGDEMNCASLNVDGFEIRHGLGKERNQRQPLRNLPIWPILYGFRR